MTLASQRVSETFAALRRDDSAGVIEQFGSLGAAHQYRRLYELTERYVKPGSSVLDWGCGRGHFSYFLVRNGFRVTAYSLEHPPEIFATLSAAEQERLTFVRVGLDEARRLPFADGEFDAAFSVGVLEHVRETGGSEQASLAELRRVLAIDGILICYHLPNRHSYIEAISRRLASYRDRGDFHLYRFTDRDIRDLCRDAGLTLLDRGRYGFLPRNSLNQLPGSLRNAPAVATVLNHGDTVLERLFSPIVQNYYFVARPSPAGGTRAAGALA
jgi:cyclopropane fatty-acyl-phospholipid synthase-like methyltransferase